MEILEKLLSEDQKLKSTEDYSDKGLLVAGLSVVLLGILYWVVGFIFFLIGLAEAIYYALKLLVLAIVSSSVWLVQAVGRAGKYFGDRAAGRKGFEPFAADEILEDVPLQEFIHHPNADWYEDGTICLKPTNQTITLEGFKVFMYPDATEEDYQELQAVGLRPVRQGDEDWVDPTGYDSGH